MATYVIGDVQGCFEPLLRLLDKIQFNPTQDTLWFCGDLINRGPQSLETLRFIYQLGNAARVVLGNHDLTLLACAHNIIPLGAQPDLQPILMAADKDILITWLREQPLLIHDPQLNFTLVHAGIYPDWDLPAAQSYATEVEQLLRGSQFKDFLNHMYGNMPAIWSENLQGYDRARFITNAFTRMRFLSSNLALQLDFKGEISNAPKDYHPWFRCSPKALAQTKIIFGHWAALNGEMDAKLSHQIIAIDTGCVWGKQLSAFCLETNTKYSVDANLI